MKVLRSRFQILSLPDFRSQIRDLKSLSYLFEDYESAITGTDDDNHGDDVPGDQFSLTRRTPGPGPAGPSTAHWTPHTVIPEFGFFENFKRNAIGAGGTLAYRANLGWFSIQRTRQIAH